MSLLDGIEDVPQAVVTKGLLLIHPAGHWSVRIAVPIYPTAKTTYSAECAEYRSTQDNIRGAYLQLSNDLYHVGVMDVDIEQLSFSFFKSSGNVLPTVTWRR